MRTILITRDGFRKEIDLEKDTPYYTLMSIPYLDMTQNVESDEVIRVERRYFRFERSFINEFDQEIKIYRERQ